MRIQFSCRKLVVMSKVVHDTTVQSCARKFGCKDCTDQGKKVTTFIAVVNKRSNWVIRIIHATDPQSSHWSKPSSTTKNFGSIGEARGRMPGQEIVNTNYNRIPNINDNTDYEDRRRLYIHFSKVGAESQTVWTAQFLFTNVLSLLSLLSRTNQWQVWE